MKFFLDTSAIYSLSDPEDAHHGRAKAIRERLDKGGTVFHTHDWVLLETVFLVQKRFGRSFAAKAVQAFLQNQAVKIHPIDPEMREAAFREYGEKAVSFVDAASFALMRREGLGLVFGFDEDFTKAGFKLERP